MARAVVIQEEISGQGYRWFVAMSQNIPSRLTDAIYRHFSSGTCNRCNQYVMPKFGRLEDAKVWCADRGLLWEVKRNDGY